MRFSNGAWLPAKGVSPSYVRRLTQYEIEGHTLRLWGVDKYGNQGADRFHGVVLSLVVTSPMEGVIRVRTEHFQPEVKGVRGFDLNYDLAAKDVAIEDRADELVYRSGRLSLRVRKGSGWEMSFWDGAERLTTTGGDGPIFARVDEPAGVQPWSAGTAPGGNGAWMMNRFLLNVGECVYGMGERFGPLVKNGQNVTIWNEDGGTMSDQAYKSIPFYITSRGYGVLVNTPNRVDFSIATERVSQIQFAVPQEELDYYFFCGPKPLEVLEKYTRLSGRPAMPPAWTYGLWLSTSFTTQYDEATVNSFIDGMAQRGIPLSVFHFDCFWMRERHWCDFLWDTKAFPDPEGMLKRLKAKGLKVCVWINSYISNMTDMFEEGRKNGYFLKRQDGNVYQIDDWQPGMALVDFTNPAACRWYQGRLRKLLEMGVDCFKTDFGERIPSDAVYFDGSDPKRMHNYYTYLYNKCVFELVEEFQGKGNALVFARSATTGGQKFPVHWGGDCVASFESMAEDLRGGLSFCASGAAFWSHDIGGFEGTANPSLYKRWVAFGLFSTHSRLHGSGSYRVPWLFDEESVDVMRHFVKVKNRLFPYMFSVSKDAHENGWPAMRAMALEFPDDPATLYLDRQYMLGSAMLVAPVFRQDDVAEYYLPRGQWTNYLTGEVVEGGTWRKEKQDVFHLPVFVRENTLLPTSSNEASPKWGLNDELTINVFQVKEGGEASVRVVADDGVGEAKFTATRKGSKLTLQGDGRAKKVRIVVWGVKSASGISNGARVADQPEGVVVSWSDPGRPLTLELA